MRDQRDPEKLGLALLGLRRVREGEQKSVRPSVLAPVTMSQLYDRNRAQLERIPDFKED